ncbi:hypothetical protein ACFQJ7_16005 [Halovenus rubra]|uniref:Uncharacterized protein n=2 Tax=Halovenus rubra TaxID=869890 RepID=A0ACC7E5N5_9EURY|nr:hypothetical protein [Halovenus rubra]
MPQDSDEQPRAQFENLSGVATRRTFLTTVGVAALSALAGCQGSKDTEETGNEDTDENELGGVASDENDTPEPLDPPEGTSEDGIEDTEKLVDATRTALTKNSYAIEQELVNTTDGEQTLHVTQRRTSNLDSNKRLLVFDAATETNRLYIENGTQFIRSTSDDETTTQSRSFQEDFRATHPPEMLGGGESLGGILRTGAFASPETVSKSGLLLLQFELDSVDESEISGTVTEETATIFVDTNSVVHKATRSLEIEEDAQTVTLDQSFVIHQLGDVSVERPDWADKAAKENR